MIHKCIIYQNVAIMELMTCNSIFTHTSNLNELKKITFVIELESSFFFRLEFQL